MDGTYPIGRIAGLEIRLHWSWAFIFVLIAWTFSEGVLDRTFPEWSVAVRIAAGAAIALIFFCSILLHEMSHSLVARHYGIPVASITLFIFGGVSSLSKEPDGPRQEFWIAIVGPLTSIAMAALFGVAALAFYAVDSPFQDVAANLAFINLAIGIFNLVPGFPLDGGRVLRSIIWARDHNILTATRLASRVGEYTAYTLMGLGLAALFFVDAVSGIWFILIGNFLRVASTDSYTQLFVERVLKGIPVERLARRDYTPVSPEETVGDLIEHRFLAGHGRYVPVMAGEELLGLITLTDLRHVPRDEWQTTTAFRTMTPVSKLHTVGLKDDLATALALMGAHGLNQIPMMDGKILSGMIDRSDLISYIQTRQAIEGGGAPSPRSSTRPG